MLLSKNRVAPAGGLPARRPLLRSVPEVDVRRPGRDTPSG